MFDRIIVKITTTSWTTTATDVSLGYAPVHAESTWIATTITGRIRHRVEVCSGECRLATVGDCHRDLFLERLHLLAVFALLAQVFTHVQKLLSRVCVRVVEAVVSNAV